MKLNLIEITDFVTFQHKSDQPGVVEPFNIPSMGQIELLNFLLGISVSDF